MTKNIFIFAEHLVTGRAFFKLRDRTARIIDSDKFTYTDAFLYFIHGALSEIFSKI